MSIFIPNRSIKLPKDISVPQSLSPSVFETHRRDQAFQMAKRFDGALVDVVSGAKSTSVISGVRYGIVNGVVTGFGVNQPALEDDGFRGCPAFTQVAKMSELLGGWTLARVEVVFSSLMFGKNINQVNSALLTYGEHDSSPGFINTDANNTIIGFCCIAANNGCDLHFRGKGRDGAYKNLSFINLLTGEISGIESNVLAVSATPIAGTSFYNCFIAINTGEGTETAVTIFPGLNKNGEVIFEGDGSGILFGQPTFINFGVNGVPFIPPYVPNNTSGSISVVSETGSATNGTSFDLDNPLMARIKTALRGPNAQGHLELTFKSNVDSGWFTSATAISLNIFTSNNSEFTGALRVRMQSSACSLRIEDNASNFIIHPSITNIAPNQTFKISIDWGTHSTGQKMMITVNGVKSVLADFSGSFGTQDLRFFYGNIVHAGWIKKDSLKIFDRPRW